MGWLGKALSTRIWARASPPEHRRLAGAGRRGAGRRSSGHPLWSFFALPPCIAFMDRAWPSPQGRPAWAHRSASHPRHARHGDHEVFPRGRQELEKRLRAGWHVPRQPALAVLAEATHGHGAGMQVDAPVCLVRWRVKSPEVSSSLVSDSVPLSAYHRGMRGRGPQSLSWHCSRPPTASAPLRSAYAGALARRERPVYRQVAHDTPA